MGKLADMANEILSKIGEFETELRDGDNSLTPRQRNAEANKLKPMEFYFRRMRKYDKKDSLEGDVPAQKIV